MEGLFIFPVFCGLIEGVTGFLPLLVLEDQFEFGLLAAGDLHADLVSFAGFRLNAGIDEHPSTPSLRASLSDLEMGFFVVFAGPGVGREVDIAAIVIDAGDDFAL